MSLTMVGNGLLRAKGLKRLDDLIGQWMNDIWKIVG